MRLTFAPVVSDVTGQTRKREKTKGLKTFQTSVLEETPEGI